MNYIKTDLMTEDEIKEYGLIFEPDASKCKSIATILHYSCSYFRDNQITSRFIPIEEAIKAGKTTREGWKKLIAYVCPFIYVNRIYVLDTDVPPFDTGEGTFCQHVKVDGHTRKELVDGIEL
jgi:hypothetical protein